MRGLQDVRGAREKRGQKMVVVGKRKGGRGTERGGGRRDFAGENGEKTESCRGHLS